MVAFECLHPELSSSQKGKREKWRVKIKQQQKNRLCLFSVSGSHFGSGGGCAVMMAGLYVLGSVTRSGDQQTVHRHLILGEQGPYYLPNSHEPLTAGTAFCHRDEGPGEWGTLYHARRWNWLELTGAYHLSLPWKREASNRLRSSNVVTLAHFALTIAVWMGEQIPEASYFIIFPDVTALQRTHTTQ